MGGWIRIGIVLTAIWVVGGGLWGHSLVSDDLQKQYGWHVDACVARNKALLRSKGDNSEPYDKIWTPCYAETSANYPTNIQSFWLGVGIFAFAPIPIAWMIIYGLVSIVRWIRRGFSAAT